MTSLGAVCDRSGDVHDQSVGVSNVVEALEVLRSSPNRSCSDLGGHISPSSSGSPPGPLRPSKYTPGKRNRMRRNMDSFPNQGIARIYKGLL